MLSFFFSLQIYAKKLLAFPTCSSFLLFYSLFLTIRNKHSILVLCIVVASRGFIDKCNAHPSISVKRQSLPRIQSLNIPNYDATSPITRGKCVTLHISYEQNFPSAIQLSRACRAAPSRSFGFVVFSFPTGHVAARRSLLPAARRRCRRPVGEYHLCLHFRRHAHHFARSSGQKTCHPRGADSEGNPSSRKPVHSQPSCHRVWHQPHHLRPTL